LHKGWNKDRNSGRVLWTEEDIPQRVRQRLLQVVSNIDALAESKAQNRTFRSVLSVKSKYTRAELDLPYVVPQFLVRADLTDPANLARAQLEGRAAAASLYGNSPSLPPSTGASGPTGDESEEETRRPEQRAAEGEATSRMGKASERPAP